MRQLKKYDDALAAFKLILDSPKADASLRNQAYVENGKIYEGMTDSKHALENYLAPLYERSTENALPEGREFFWVCKGGFEAVKLLVEEVGADVNFVADTGETAMHAAAYRGANSVVQYLFDKGVKLDVADKSGRTPLRVADGVEYGNSFAAQPQTAELLRKLGAKEIPCPGLCLNMMPEEVLPPEESKK